MISYQQAREIILSSVSRLKPQTLPLAALNGRVMAEPAIAPYDLPRFDQSAVDGYGVRLTDTGAASSQQPAQLILQKTLQAGNFSNEPLLAGHAVRIFTGAPVPPGVEAIIMQEACRVKGREIIVYEAPQSEENIRRRGREFQAGSIVLPANTRITPPVVGMLATLGYASFPVYPPPLVALVISGDELVQPGHSLQPGQIYDANAHSLGAALRETGISDYSVFYAPDEWSATLAVIAEALESHTLLITVGGVSVGDFDFIKPALEELGVCTRLWRIAMKPGKPVYFGARAKAGDSTQWVFGLPGNPVSALVTFHQFVRPALQTMMGLPPAESGNGVGFSAALTKSLGSQRGRRDLVRGQVNRTEGQCTVSPTTGQESHMLGGLAAADCLIHVPEDAERLEAGQTVNVELLCWGQ